MCLISCGGEALIACMKTDREVHISETFVNVICGCSHMRLSFSTIYAIRDVKVENVSSVSYA